MGNISEQMAARGGMKHTVLSMALLVAWPVLSLSAWAQIPAAEIADPNTHSTCDTLVRQLFVASTAKF